MDEVFPLVTALLGHSTEYENTARTKGVHTVYSVIIVVVIGDIRQLVCGEKDLCGLEENVRELNRMVIEIIDEHDDFGLYSLKYCIPEHIVEKIRRPRPLSVLDRSPYQHSNVQISQS